MTQSFVTVAFRYSVPDVQFDEENGPRIAERVAGFPGLLWKTWLHNPERRECMGVYRFATEEDASTYVDGPVVAHLRELEGYHDVDARVWGVIDENSRITRSPGLDDPALL